MDGEARRRVLVGRNGPGRRGVARYGLAAQVDAVMHVSQVEHAELVLQTASAVAPHAPLSAAARQLSQALPGAGELPFAQNEVAHSKAQTPGD